MKSKKLWLGALLLAGTLYASAQRGESGRWDRDDKDVVRRDTLTQDGYTLIWVEKLEDFSDSTRARMIRTFFQTYPAQAAIYNPESRKTVRIVMDPGYKGVAAAGSGVIRVNPDWMKKNPEDIDVVTHEGMHIVQSYPGGAGPGWVTEGVADYVRYKMGVNNAAGNWSLPALKENHHYTNAYRVTARFFVWIESKHGEGLVKKLDHAMRSKEYSEEFWKTHTGKTVDELWTDYKADPALPAQP